MADRNKLDYVLINTGYTSRLIKLLGFDVINCIKSSSVEDKNKVFRVGYSHDIDKTTTADIDKILERGSKWRGNLNEAFTFDDRENGIIPDDYIEEFINFMKNCLFIYDDLWGEGLYKIGDDEEIEKVLSSLKGHNLSGTICFNCGTRDDIMSYATFLKKLEYCVFFDYEGDSYINCPDMVITVASFDTESG